MSQPSNPISEIFKYGGVAFRYYAKIYKEQVEHYAKVGILIRNPKVPGGYDILPIIKDITNRDHLAATAIVADKLEELKNAAFVQEQNKITAAPPQPQQSAPSGILVPSASVEGINSPQEIVVTKSENGTGLKVVTSDKAA